MKGKQKINYKMTKVISKPTKVEFYDKSGKPVYFKARQTMKVEDLEAKELVKWLKRNGFKSLAKALSTAIGLTSI
mgnify:CR=1 FL=1